MISSFWAPPTPSAFFLTRLDPRSKLIAALLLLLAISANPHLETLWIPSLLIALLLIASRPPIRRLLRQLLLFLPFLLTLGGLFWLSHILQIGAISPIHFWKDPLGLHFQLIAIKTTLAVIVLKLLTLSTPINEILWAMRRLKLPKIVTTLANLAYAYLHLLASETERTLRAKNSRSACRSKRPWLTFSHIAATIFLRSLSRADQLYKSMLSRGFCGEYPEVGAGRLGRWDLLAVALSALAWGWLWTP